MLCCVFLYTYRTGFRTQDEACKPVVSHCTDPDEKVTAFTLSQEEVVMAARTTDSRLSRRGFISTAAAAGGAVVVGAVQSAQARTGPAEARSGFGYCLNTGTIRGQKLGLAKMKAEVQKALA